MNVNRSNKKNGFSLKKTTSRRYPAETITDADYAVDLRLLTNTPAQAQYLLHSLVKPARGIGIYVNAKKRVFMCYKQEAISTLRGKSLESVDLFSYIGSNISFAESDASIRIGKIWIAIGGLLIISDPSGERNGIFSHSTTPIQLLGRKAK